MQHDRDRDAAIRDQLSLYRSVLDAAQDMPVTFRTLDIGGDKILPYMRHEAEENPALGWRAIRLGLDGGADAQPNSRAAAAPPPAAISRSCSR